MKSIVKKRKFLQILYIYIYTYLGFNHPIPNPIRVSPTACREIVSQVWNLFDEDAGGSLGCKLEAGN